MQEGNREACRGATGWITSAEMALRARRSARGELTGRVKAQLQAEPRLCPKRPSKLCRRRRGNACGERMTNAIVCCALAAAPTATDTGAWSSQHAACICLIARDAWTSYERLCLIYRGGAASHVCVGAAALCLSRSNRRSRCAHDGRRAGTQKIGN